MKCVIFCLLAFFAYQSEFAVLPGNDDDVNRLNDQLKSQLKDISNVSTDFLLEMTYAVRAVMHTDYNTCLPHEDIVKYDKNRQDAYDKCNACYNGQNDAKIAGRCCDRVIETLKKQVKVTHDKAIECEKNKENKKSGTDESKEKEKN